MYLISILLAQPCQDANFNLALPCIGWVVLQNFYCYDVIGPFLPALHNLRYRTKILDSLRYIYYFYNKTKKLRENSDLFKSWLLCNAEKPFLKNHTLWERVLDKFLSLIRIFLCLNNFSPRQLTPEITSSRSSRLKWTNI